MIRKAQIQEAKRIAEIYCIVSKNAYKDFVKNNNLRKSLKQDVQTENYKARIQENRESLYIYEKNEKILGFISFISQDTYIELLQLYVDTESRKQGIGNALLEFLEKYAKKMGIQEIFLWTIKENMTAKKFYEKRGFLCTMKERLLEKYHVKQIQYLKNL